MRRRSLVPIAALGAALAACTHSVQTVAASPQPARPSAAVVKPVALATARARAGAARVAAAVTPRVSAPRAVVQATAAPASPTPPPAATATPIVYLAPDAPPQILGFTISANVVHPGDVLSGTVTASSNVASVEVRVAGYSFNMQKTEPGHFALAVTIPNVPKMFRRTYPLVAIARNTRGDATQRETQLTIQ